MSSDRLEGLRRQRALIAAHLAWLDAEIAAASPTPESATARPDTRAAGPTSPTPLDTPTAPAAPLPSPAGLSPTRPAAAATVASTPAPSVSAPAVSGPAPSAAAQSVPEIADAAADDADPVAVANARADEIIAEYAVTDRFDAAATRRGCFLFAALVFLLGVGGLLALYYLRYR